jgi:hypothetical protein
MHSNPSLPIHRMESIKGVNPNREFEPGMDSLNDFC